MNNMYHSPPNRYNSCISYRYTPFLQYLFIITFNFLLFLSVSLLYIVSTWDNITIAKIIYHINRPIHGVEKSLIFIYLTYITIPLSVFNILYFLLERFRFHFRSFALLG